MTILVKTRPRYHQQETCRQFIDGIATTAETTVQPKHLLIKLIYKLNSVRLTVKPEKCRSAVIKTAKLVLVLKPYNLASL